MSELKPGQRTTVRHHVERFNGQHGTINRIDPATTDRPVHVTLDGESEPRHFNPDELGPNTEDREAAEQLQNVRDHADLLTATLTTNGISLTDQENTLIGWLSGWDDATVQQIAHWVARAHAAGALRQRQDAARLQLAMIDARFVTAGQWAGKTCILCGTDLAAGGEPIGDVGRFSVYACAGGCQAGSEHPDAGTTAAGEITGSAEQDGEQP